ncbi:hypothetical protein LINGRAHAP2_LOCUS17437 [Linum grandiflorum]
MISTTSLWSTLWNILWG